MYKFSILLVSLFLCCEQPFYAQADDVEALYLNSDEKPVRPLDARQRHLQKENADLMFPGGVHALKAFILENLEYPDFAVENSIEGTVVAKISIDETGKVRNAYILRSLHAQCDSSVLKLIDKMPQWYPQINYGHAVSNSVILPVRFSLTWN